MFKNLDIKKKIELSEKFKFGIESEYCIVSLDKFEPLWHQKLSFEELNGIFEKIDLAGTPSCEGLDLEFPQKKIMPFVVEGYHLPDMDFNAKEILPKGVEIRTPVCSSINQVLDTHKILYRRLKNALNENNYELVCLSHHPTEYKFVGPQNKRRHDYWQWSMEVMTTYGPDINVGLPEELMKLISIDDLLEKINYYGAALSAISVASPFCGGVPWEYAKGKYGKSYRMHKRSYIAPPIEVHLNENNRLELKIFDMPNSIIEIEAQILCFLLLILDSNLTGRASHQTRIYELGEVAKKGLEADDIKLKLEEVLKNSDEVLSSWGFDSAPLAVFKNRLLTGVTPADEMLALYFKNNSLTEVLINRSHFVV